MTSSPSLLTRSSAEFLGTFWLVLGGCGSAVLVASFPNADIGFLGVAASFGLTVLTVAYAIGHISGCHLNPAVSPGLVVANRFPVSEIPAYVSPQVLGSMAASGVLYLIARGKATSPKAHARFAPIAIGLTLSTVHLIGIPVTNLSVNPARSTGPALLIGGWALGQLWMFWLATGSLLAGVAYRALVSRSDDGSFAFSS